MVTAKFLEEEAHTEADLVLRIDYDPSAKSASRAFRIAADLINGFEELDSIFAESIHSEIETSLLLEDLQKSSIRIFLKNVIEDLPDDALKEGSAAKIVGHFLLKAKYAALTWLDQPEEGNPKLADLTETVARLAEATDLRRLPDYPAPNPNRLAQPL